MASPIYGAALSNPGLIDGAGSGIFQDPTYWPVQRRMGLAQALMNEGLSAAPAYPMQALARVVQAGLGGWLENRAEKELQDTIAKQGADAVAAYQAALGPLGASLMPPALPGAAQLPPAPQAPPAPSYGGGGPGASVEMPKEYAQHYAEASQRTGIPVEVLQAKDRQESGFNPGATGAAGEIGIGQISPKTAASPGFGMQGVQNPDTLRDPRANINFGADYLAARAGKIDWHDPVQVAAALKSYNGGGDPNYAANVMRYLPQNYAMAAASPQAGQQQQASGDGAVHPMSAGAPSGPWDVAAGGNTASDVRPAVPMPGAAPGGGGAATPLPQPQQVAQGGGQPAPQQLGQVAQAQAQTPPTGAQSPNIQQAIRLMQTAASMRLHDPYGRTTAVLAQSLEQQAQLLMTMDTFRPDMQNGVAGQRNLRNGQFIPDPARRMMSLPDGRIINDQGQIIGFAAPYEIRDNPDTGQPTYYPKYPTSAGLSATPLAPQQGGMTGAFPVPGTTPRTGFAEEQTNEAKRLSSLREEVLNRAKESAQSTTMIQNAEGAMQKAMQGQIPPGQFGPELLRGVAAAKYLGINLKPFGIDETALAAGQVTREQLQQLNGAILRKMYPQRITNMDIMTTGASLPNYGLDPAALTANFEIYKKQNAYDTAMGRDMLAYEHDHNGSLKGWEQHWYEKSGFSGGPLETMFQDDKNKNFQPVGGTPAGGSQAPQPSRADIEAEMRRRGLLK